MDEWTTNYVVGLIRDVIRPRHLVTVPLSNASLTAIGLGSLELLTLLVNCAETSGMKLDEMEGLRTDTLKNFEDLTNMVAAIRAAGRKDTCAP